MKRYIIFFIALIILCIVGFFFLINKKATEQKEVFSGPQGAPFVKGPFGPPPGN